MNRSMTRNQSLTSAAFLSVFLLLFFAEARGAQSSSGRKGYIFTVTEEREEQISEMVLMQPPAENDIALKKAIFTDRLTKEFELKYREQFGPTEVEQNLYTPSRFEEYEYSNGLSVTYEEDRRAKQEFASYMLRRMTEYHVDAYFKSSPSLKPVYELKDRVSHLDLEVKRGYKVKFNYSLSGNHLDLRAENPYEINTRLRFLMDGGPFSETILTIGSAIGKRHYLEALAYADQGRLSLIASHRLYRNMNISLTGTTNYRFSPRTEEGENLILAGFTWNQ